MGANLVGGVMVVNLNPGGSCASTTISPTVLKVGQADRPFGGTLTSLRQSASGRTPDSLLVGQPGAWRLDFPYTEAVHVIPTNGDDPGLLFAPAIAF